MRTKAWLLCLALAAPAVAEENSVDSEQQCTVFKRIFSYDKHLRNTDNIIVLVVGQTKDGADAERVAAAFRAKDMYPVNVTVDGLDADLTATLSPQSTVVYVMPDVDYAAVVDFATDRGFLTVSGHPLLAEMGKVSVSVDLSAGRPQVVVNMPRLVAEGHELSSELLKLARVIR